MTNRGPEQYTFIKFVILVLAILLLVALLVLTLSRAQRGTVIEPSQTPTATATTRPTEVAVVSATDTPTPSQTVRPSETPQPTPTATDFPPSDTPEPPTATRQPTRTVTSVPSITVAAVTPVSSATPTATPRPPTATPSPTATAEPPPDVQPQINAPQVGASVPPGRLQIQGFAAPNTSIRVMEGSEVLGTTYSDASGGWGLTLTRGLPTGPHTIRAETTDESGTVVGRSEAVSFDVLQTVMETTGGEDIPWPVTLLLAGTLLALGLVFVLAGGTLRAWERTRRS